jgi:type VI secretion system secreted protein VgrG
MAPTEECVYRFAFSRQVRSGKMTRRDYNFEKPTLDLKKEEQAKVHEKLEVYDYPGRYVEPDRGKQLSKVRLEESMTYYETAEGESTCVRLVPGFKFSLSDHEHGEYNREYFLTKLVTRGEQPQSLQEKAGSGGGEFSYSSRFTAIPASVPFRPARVTPKPLVEGIQTARVTGPGGEEIYTDKYGRVKVKFHWDRGDDKDEKSSCWVRVSSTFAGTQYGAIFTPRIGHEVVVDFLEGDPDRPLITGSVYNADRMPPYELPGEKTKSTTKTDSSLGGGGFNELRFEDKKGSEEIFRHAEKDENIVVKNNQTIFVGNDRAEKIGRDRSLEVDRDKSENVLRNKTVNVLGGHTETIGSSMSIMVGSTLTETVVINYAETVGGAMELTVGAALAITAGGAMAETVGGAKVESIGGAKSENVGVNRSVNVGGTASEAVGKGKTVSIGKDLKETVGGQHQESVTKEYILNAKKVQIIGQDEISIKTGSAEILLKKNGDITVKGKKISIKGSGDVIIKGSKILEN